MGKYKSSKGALMESGRIVILGSPGRNMSPTEK
jgi:hypothetical protein